MYHTSTRRRPHRRRPRRARSRRAARPRLARAANRTDRPRAAAPPRGPSFRKPRTNRLMIATCTGACAVCKYQPVSTSVSASRRRGGGPGAEDSSHHAGDSRRRDASSRVRTSLAILSRRELALPVAAALRFRDEPPPAALARRGRSQRAANAASPKARRKEGSAPFRRGGNPRGFHQTKPAMRPRPPQRGAPSR